MFKKMGEAISVKWLLGLTALFIVTLCISIIYHLPISWLLTQPSIQKQLPSSLQLKPSYGTLWQGNAQMSTLTPNLVHLGKIDWELSFWPLLIGQATVQNVWQKEQSQLRSQLKFPLFSESTELNVTDLDGKIALPLLIEMLNITDLQSMDVSGILQIKHMDLLLDLPTQWPSIFTGTLILKQLHVLGETLPEITITPDLDGDKLVLNIKGKEQEWSLSGQLEVSNNKRFNIQLKVTAQSPSAMPGWAEMLRKQSPTVAVLNHRGVW
ncbi:hypothetical protein MNBD_GAMMA03-86 [hydrothermal vent metagenome]|uniref:General secretion pathway protein N n=1 Tax=hydrothermal vent metagenome TaxID=652676 RepID=A0A3B0WW80_9ZZZZ